MSEKLKERIQYMRSTHCRCLDVGQGVSSGPSQCGSCDDFDELVSLIDSWESPPMASNGDELNEKTNTALATELRSRRVRDSGKQDDMSDLQETCVSGRDQAEVSNRESTTVVPSTMSEFQRAKEKAAAESADRLIGTNVRGSGQYNGHMQGFYDGVHFARAWPKEHELTADSVTVKCACKEAYRGHDKDCPKVIIGKQQERIAELERELAQLKGKAK